MLWFVLLQFKQKQNVKPTITVFFSLFKRMPLQCSLFPNFIILS